MRLFVAVDPSKEVREGLRLEIERLRGMAPAAKWLSADAIHLTLAFLGEIDDALVPSVASAIEGVAPAFAPIELEARGGGAFGRPARPSVLWSGISGDVEGLASLKLAVEEVLRPLGYDPDPREFRPHFTIARSRAHGGDRTLASCALALAGSRIGAFRVDTLLLYRSELTPAGPVYTALVRAPLSA